MENLIRLNKYLSESGICSRREADEHISHGEVKINGMIAVLGQKIDPEKDRIEYLGKNIRKNIQTVIYALNKPRGVISTADDELGRKNITDFVPKETRVYPIGRLDKESEGLILLTNDGTLAQELSHPSHKYEKEYKVTIRIINSKLNIKDIEHNFQNGLRIDNNL